ncbi:hypothetical protein DM860_001312 [Cuscuta australis]|uniref:Nucleotide-diphospho-sugar transferase domain-containing protein n=1 Tax=Cuscuta australis TaxID=267555 RepID=A0A328DTI7_9ASTE|nr:hypothetical protein DM860_001312 [Cuscuta australis]
MKPTKMAAHGGKNASPTTTMAALFLLFLLAFLCFSTRTPISPVFPQNHHSNQRETQLLPAAPPRDRLEEALGRAAMAGTKTVIITIINQAYVEPVSGEPPSMLDLFLEGFWEGEGTRELVDHLLVVAMDDAAYRRCLFRRLHCYGPITTTEEGGVDFSGEKVFMSKEFINMMWRRTLFLLDVLKHGYNFIFSDTDIIWLRNPFTKLSSNTTEDLQISTDIFTGDPWSTANPINTGFYYVRSNPKTLKLFETWYDMREKYPPQMKEQDILAIMKRGGIFKEMGLLVRYLDAAHFNGFCANSGDVAAVATVHANCCRGITAKVAGLKSVLQDWKVYKTSRGNPGNFRWSEHVFCKNSWGPTPSN